MTWTPPTRQATLPKHAPLKKTLEFAENTFTFNTGQQSLVVSGPGGEYVFSATGVEELCAALRSIGKDPGEVSSGKAHR